MYESEQLTLTTFPSGVPIETTVHTYGSGDPVVYVQAAQHGREVNGTEVLHRIHNLLVDDSEGAAPDDEAGTDSEELGGDPDAISAADLDGTLITVPVADPITFDHVSYTTPESLDSVNPNMNRCWPGDSDGTLHERMAAKLWEYAGEADYVVDLHTGSPDMLTHTVYLDGDDQSRRLAEAFGAKVLLAEAAGDDADTEWDERNFGGKFRVAATREGIPSITPELAYNKQFVEKAIRSGVEGLQNVLREVGVLDDDADPWDGVVARNHLGRVTAEGSGVFLADGEPNVGDEIREGEYVGTLYHPTTFETVQTVEADRDGILYSVAKEATVTAGATLAGVAERIE